MQLIVATRNAHKTREIQQILGQDFAVSDLSAHPEIPETREHGKSFEENAMLKAIGASSHGPLHTRETLRRIAVNHVLIVTSGRIFRGKLSVIPPQFAFRWNRLGCRGIWRPPYFTSMRRGRR